MKKSSIVVALVVSAFCAQAQNLQEAITKSENERFEAAAADFKALIAKDATKGDYYFYYGENFFNSDNLDSALIMYKKGADAQATNPLNYVGMGKVLLMQGNDKEANTNLFKAKTLGAKNATAYIKLAEAYVTAPNPYKNLTEASKLLTDAMKWEPKNAEAHIFMGDCLLEQNPTDGSPAIKEYNEALKLNPKSPKGVLRIGKLWYRARNYNLALDFYKQAIAIDPNFAPAYLEMAELYQLAGQPGKALEAIKKYIELNGSSLYAHKKYAGYLLLNKLYPETIAETEENLKKDAGNAYQLRYRGYAFDELGDKTDKDANVKGLDAMNKFFEVADKQKVKVMIDDYRHKGNLLFKSGQDSLGTLELTKAIAMDSVKNCELNGDIGKYLVKAKKYDKAIYYYEKRALCAKAMSGQDYFDLGRAYFYAAAPKIKAAMEVKDAKERQKKEAEVKPQLVKADSAFSKLCQASPTFPTGYYWRGRVNVQLDPNNDQWLAKPHFEKYLSLVKPEERAQPANKDNVIVSCEYLGYYYMKMKDNAKAKEMWTIVKELEPANKKAEAFFKSPEGK